MFVATAAPHTTKRKRERPSLDAATGTLKYVPAARCSCWYSAVPWERKGSPAVELATMHVLRGELTPRLRAVELNSGNEGGKTPVPVSEMVRHTEFPGTGHRRSPGLPAQRLSGEKISRGFQTGVNLLFA